MSRCMVGMANSATLLAEFGSQEDLRAILSQFNDCVCSGRCSVCGMYPKQMSSPRTGRLVNASPGLDKVYFIGFNSVSSSNQFKAIERTLGDGRRRRY